MKVTKIRQLQNNKLVKITVKDLENLKVIIETNMAALGFLCDVYVLNRTTLKIGRDRMQFKIDVEKHGYNTRHSFGTMKRTRVPSWDQRVQFNNELNRILTSAALSANVTSGPFEIRRGFEERDERFWCSTMPEYLLSNEARGFYVEQGDYKAEKVRA